MSLNVPPGVNVDELQPAPVRRLGAREPDRCCTPERRHRTPSRPAFLRSQQSFSADQIRLHDLYARHQGPLEIRAAGPKAAIAFRRYAKTATLYQHSRPERFGSRSCLRFALCRQTITSRVPSISRAGVGDGAAAHPYRKDYIVLVADSLEFLSGKWWTFLLRGMIALGLALLAFAQPAATAGAFAYVAAAYFVSSGALALLGGISFSGIVHSWALVLMGLAQMFLGIVMFDEPGAGRLALAYLVAIWSFSTGLMEISAGIALRSRMADEFWWILVGAISLVMSCYVIVRPDLGLLALVYAIAIYAALAGASLIVLAFCMKGAGAKVDRLGGHSRHSSQAVPR
jgi:uncharacterized membrane protein HdeD (DUF308 family)